VKNEKPAPYTKLAKLLMKSLENHYERWGRHERPKMARQLREFADLIDNTPDLRVIA